MKQLWTGNDPVKLAILRSELDAKGIRFSVRNECLRAAMGEIPPIETWPELWVEDDECFHLAQVILDDIESSEETT